MLGIPQCNPGRCRGGGVHAVTAPHFRGPYTFDRGREVFGWPVGAQQGWPSDGFVYEDPFLFFRRSARRWYMLLHQYNASDPAHQIYDGGLAVSDGEDLHGEWSWASWHAPVYTGRVAYIDGSSAMMQRRERPFVLFGQDGEPEALYSAVCPGSCPGGTGFCVQCYTIANPLKSNAEGQHIGLDASA